MTKQDKQNYYNDLREKYKEFADDERTRLDFIILTLIKSPSWKKFKNDEIAKLYCASDLPKLKNGFLRSFDKVYNNPNYNLETKKRIFKNMIMLYMNFYISITNQIESLRLQETKNGRKYTFYEKLEDVKKIKRK